MIALVFPWVVCLMPGQQIVIMSCTKKYVVNGPKVVLVPLGASYYIREALTLVIGEYAHIKDELTGLQHLLVGPAQYFLGENEIVEIRRNSYELQDTDYIRVLNKETAEIQHLQGPRIFSPSPDEVVQETSTGRKLTANEYLRIKNVKSGDVSMVHGPILFFPAVHEVIVSTHEAIALRKGEYVRLIDKNSGEIRVECGEKLVFLNAYEEILQHKSKAIVVDDQTAVLVRDVRDGQLSLVTEHQNYIPDSNFEVVERTKKIVLEESVVAVVVEKDGTFTYKKGTDSFFLEPHTKLLRMNWSCGLEKDAKFEISHFDIKPHFMWYQFVSRSKDNVELVINVTFFWRIEDMKTMVQSTDDTVGDICSHARSVIIQAISQLTMEEFLSQFNEVIRHAVLKPSDSFYSDRGSSILEVEVRSVSCMDPETQNILQQIIKENTQRINRLQQQTSLNEVALARYDGEIEAERKKKSLMEVREEVLKLEGQMEGEAQARRVHAFLDELGDSITTEQKLLLLNNITRADTLEHLSKGPAHLYFTPSDVDLKIVSQ